MKTLEQLYYHYDEEADVFYLSRGKPKASDTVTESADDVILRTDPRTGKIRGFTVLNFSKRQRKGSTPIKLPINAQWTVV
jgi:uncharacterized protein YuzE